MRQPGLSCVRCPLPSSLPLTRMVQAESTSCKEQGSLSQVESAAAQLLTGDQDDLTGDHWQVLVESTSCKGCFGLQCWWEAFGSGPPWPSSCS